MVINCARNTGYQTWSVRAVFYLLLHMTQPRIGNDKDEHIHLTVVEYNKTNRPFYSCLLSDLAIEWQRGCR